MRIPIAEDDPTSRRHTEAKHIRCGYDVAADLALYRAKEYVCNRVETALADA